MLIFLIVLSQASGIAVLHQLPDSETLDISIRSWTLNGLDVQNRDTAMISVDPVVFLLHPKVINLCGKEELASLVSGDQLLADDADDPAVLIGKMSDIEAYLANDSHPMVRTDPALLHRLSEQVEVGMTPDNRVLHYETRLRPCILSASNMTLLSRFSNYIPYVNAMVGWAASDKWHGHCYICETAAVQQQQQPVKVVIAAYIWQWTPLLRHWLTMLLSQVVVKGELFYLVYNAIPEHQSTVEDVTGASPLEGLLLPPSFMSDKDERTVRAHTTVMCRAVGCTHLLSVDSDVSILRSDMLSHLISLNKSLVTTKVNHLRERVNFAGSVDSEGPAEAPDHWDIVDGVSGWFVVGYFRSLFLAHSSVLPEHPVENEKGDKGPQPDSFDSYAILSLHYRDRAVLAWLDTTLVSAVYTDMERTEGLPLPDEDLYNAALNWKPWVEYSLRKTTAFQLDPVDSLIGKCGLIIPLFTEPYCGAFVRAVEQYQWPDGALRIPLSQLKYENMAEGIITMGVVPYIRERWNLPDNTFFHQNQQLFKKTDEVSLACEEPLTFHLIWFWSEASADGKQGVRLSPTQKQDHCAVDLPPGHILVVPCREEPTAPHIELIGQDVLGVLASVVFVR